LYGDNKMAKPEWGTKRIGPCGTKFYDFNKSPVICPNCGGEVILKEEKIKSAKNLEKEKTKVISQEQNLIEDNNDVEDELDGNILDDELIDEDNNLAGTVENDIEDNISEVQDIDLIKNDDEIALDVNIEDNEK
tara:strand:- start:2537 stop:2938 length:402 start_codon:yes stop_codon:yes gene_type:complete